MSLSILNNIPSLVAQNQLAVTNTNLQNTLFQLSSGSKINSGADDPAGLSIADGLQANIAALTQSAQNVTNGVGMLQTADGALSQVTTLLNRAVTLATEAGNAGLTTGTNSQTEALQNEFTSITNEITQIGNNTTFNNTKVFSGTNLNVFLSDGSQNDATNGATISTALPNLTTTSLGLGTPGSATFALTAQAAANDTVSIGGQAYTFIAAGASATTAYQVNLGTSIQGTLQNLQSVVNATPPSAGISITAVNGGSVTVQDTAGNGAIAASLTNGGGWVGGGAAMTGYSATASLSTTTAAQAALVTIGNAISTVAADRGAIGSGINQMNAAVQVMNSTSQNLTSSLSGIQDANIGQVVANMSKYQVLEQTGISALAQSNQQEQTVLKLLQ